MQVNPSPNQKLTSDEVATKTVTSQARLSLHCARGRGCDGVSDATDDGTTLVPPPRPLAGLRFQAMRRNRITGSTVVARTVTSSEIEAKYERVTACVNS